MTRSVKYSRLPKPNRVRYCSKGGARARVVLPNVRDNYVFDYRSYCFRVNDYENEFDGVGGYRLTINAPGPRLVGNATRNVTHLQETSHRDGTLVIRTRACRWRRKREAKRTRWRGRGRKVAVFRERPTASHWTMPREHGGQCRPAVRTADTRECSSATGSDGVN